MEGSFSQSKTSSLRGVPGTGLRGLYGRPFLSLDGLLDLRPLEKIHEEICVALSQFPTDYTGGSHRSMRIMPEGREHEALTDYVEVLQQLSDEDFQTFCSLSDDEEFRSHGLARRSELSFGEERQVPLSRRQMLWLEYRWGVYFPWKVYAELIPNRWWGEKSSAAGKRFTRLAEALLPQTLAFVRSLPFSEIGRCNIMGLRAHDHGTVHRDGEPEEQQAPDQFLTFCPAANKTLYLWDPLRQVRVPVLGRAYWFNDFDYHGVESAPFFRYSLRVDGVFRPEFLAQIEAHFAVPPTETNAQ